MSVKHISSFGYLLEALNIRGEDLAQYLHIERTTVSKWKSGARALRQNSAYFQDVFQYFLHVNSTASVNKLGQIFSELYPNRDASSSDYLWYCFCEFIKSNEIFLLQSLQTSTESKSYCTDIAIYRGVDGRKDAMDIFLDYIDSLQEPHDIYILDREQFVWIASDMLYLEKWISRIRKILEKGHHIDNLHFLAENYPEYHRFLRHTMEFVFLPNVRVFSIGSHFSEKIFATMYIVKDKFALTGYNSSNAGSPLYTALYHDLFSIQQFQTIYNLIIARSNIVSVSEDPIQADLIVQNIRDREYPLESTFFKGPMLSFTTMSEALLHEILDANQFSSSDRERCILLYHSLRLSMLNNPVQLPGGYFHHLNDLHEMLHFKKISQYELSAFSGHTVILTQEQHIRHVQDTINLLRRNPHCKFTLSYGSGTAYALPISLWMKDRLWFCAIGAMTGRALFCTDPAAMAMLTKSCNELWYNTPADLHDNMLVAKMLEKLLKDIDASS